MTFLLRSQLTNKQNISRKDAHWTQFCMIVFFPLHFFLRSSLVQLGGSAYHRNTSVSEWAYSYKTQPTVFLADNIVLHEGWKSVGSVRQYTTPAGTGRWSQFSVLYGAALAWYRKCVALFPEFWFVVSLRLWFVMNICIYVYIYIYIYIYI